MLYIGVRPSHCLPFEVTVAIRRLQIVPGSRFSSAPIAIRSDLHNLLKRRQGKLERSGHSVRRIAFPKRHALANGSLQPPPSSYMFGHLRTSPATAREAFWQVRVYKTDMFVFHNPFRSSQQSYFASGSLKLLFIFSFICAFHHGSQSPVTRLPLLAVSSWPSRGCSTRSKSVFHHLFLLPWLESPYSHLTSSQSQ